MLPFIQREIIDINSWLTISEFIDIIGIAQMTPGSIGINFDSFVGYKVSGIILWGVF